MLHEKKSNGDECPSNVTQIEEMFISKCSNEAPVRDGHVKPVFGNEKCYLHLHVSFICLNFPLKLTFPTCPTPLFENSIMNITNDGRRVDFNKMIVKNSV